MADKPIFLTGLFKTGNKSLLVGSVDDLTSLIELIKEAKVAKKGITFFLWRNDGNTKSTAIFNLKATMAQDRQQQPFKRSGPNRPIKQDDAWDAPENEADDIFS